MPKITRTVSVEGDRVKAEVGIVITTDKRVPEKDILDSLASEIILAVKRLQYAGITLADVKCTDAEYLEP